MQKIIFGITGLTLGGAERVLVDIANELSSKFDITIFTIYAKGEFEKELSKDINLISLTDKSYDELSRVQKIAMSLKLIINKKTIYNKYINNGYKTEIAFLEGPITRLFSVKNSKVKKIAWVHNDINKVFGKGVKSKVKKVFDRKCYSRYNDIVFVSNDNKEQFEETYKLNNNKHVISNYISVNRVIKKSEDIVGNVFKNEAINFLTVARLTEQKGIDRLIKVHSKLIDDGYNHNFFCIGDGPERDKLKELIKKYNVEKSFVLLGKKDNPYPYMKKCDVFALLSYYEGYPMTILEAKILNKQILLTDTAAREAVEGYNKSYVTENSENGVYEGIRNTIKILTSNDNMPKDELYNNNDLIEKIEKLVK